MTKTKLTILKYVSVLLILPLIAITAACDQATTPNTPDASIEDGSGLMSLNRANGNAGVRGNVASQLAEVRRVTAPFHNFDKAVEAGWFAQLSPCVDHPEMGGMGYHYGNPAYLGNGYIDHLKPEALLYEPMKNGKLRLVGVEYILFYGPPAEEGGEPVKGEQPSLFGEHFHDSPHVGPHGAWTLHVWLWRNNPSGMFADFNPNVTCDYAP